MKTFELTNNTRLVINMSPFSCIKVKKLPRRKMEVSFPNGCRCFYKLLIDFGCGSAWSKWRDIGDVGVSKKQNYPSRGTLIRFADLDSHAQNYLRTEKFLRPPKLLTEVLSLHKSNDDATEEDEPIQSKPSYDMTNFCKKRGHLFKTESLGKVLEDRSGLTCHVFEAEVHLPKKEFAGITSDYAKRKLAFSETIQEIEKARDDEKPAGGLGLKPIVGRSKGPRKTRKVRRFGEGIPDGCTFDLSLSYSDSVSEEETAASKRVLKKESTKMSPFDYLIDEKVALKDIRRSQHLTPIKEVDSSKKSLKQTSEILKKERTKMSPFDYLIDEKVAFKDISHSQHLIPIKDVDSSKKSIKQTSEIASYCPNISSLTLISREIQRSQSVDSIISIESTPYHLGYLKFNLSLPNLDDILFHRRTNRLTYDSQFDRSRPEEGNELSFRIPEVGNENSSGRVYNPTPLSRKLEALKMKSIFLEPNIQLLSSQKIDRSRSANENSSTNSPSSLELHDDEHDTCGKGTGISDLTKKLIDEMENEYPIRHSLWIESPDAKNQKPSPQDRSNLANTENASGSTSKETDKLITEVSQEMVARGLRAFQQDLFCKIESSELARFILKPHTVTEVNSPYLCGYLYFYERTRNLIISEILSKRTTSEMADVFRYFVQVAYFCVQLRDKQSTCAILSGLCNLAVLRHQALWSTLHGNMPNEMRILSQILQIDWNEKKHETVKSEIPFFRSILKVLVEELPQEFTPYTYKRRRFSEFVQEWYRWRRGRKEPETLVDQLTNALSQFFTKCIGKKKNPETQLDYSSDDLFTTRYRELEGILNVIEESRKYYLFTIDSFLIDKDARYFLLNKKL